MYIDPTQGPGFDRSQFLAQPNTPPASGNTTGNAPADSAQLTNQTPSYLQQLGQIVANNPLPQSGAEHSESSQLSNEQFGGMLDVLGSVYGAGGGGSYGITG